jgi:hypothetical protein
LSVLEFEGERERERESIGFPSSIQLEYSYYLWHDNCVRGAMSTCETFIQVLRCKPVVGSSSSEQLRKQGSTLDNVGSGQKEEEEEQRIINASVVVVVNSTHLFSIEFSNLINCSSSYNKTRNKLFLSLQREMLKSELQAYGSFFRNARLIECQQGIDGEVDNGRGNSGRGRGGRGDRGVGKMARSKFTKNNYGNKPY